MTEPMSDERLAEIREREQAASEGPWWSDDSSNHWRLYGVFGRIPPQLDGAIPEQVIKKQLVKAPKRNTPYVEYWPEPADAEFIVKAREDVPALLAEVKRLRAEQAEKDGEIGGLHETIAAADAEVERLQSKLAAETARADRNIASFNDLNRRISMTGLGREVARADRAETARDRLAEQVQRVRMVRCWTNEDGRAFVFADDLRVALDGEGASDA